MNERIAVEIIHGGHEAILELLLRCDADVAQDGAGEFGKEALDEIEPGAVFGCEGEFEAVRGLTGEPGSGLFGDVRGMIVEDQLDRRVGRIRARSTRLAGSVRDCAIDFNFAVSAPPSDNSIARRHAAMTFHPAPS